MEITKLFKVFDYRCQHCSSYNIDVVDEDNDSVKYICRDCNEDFIVTDYGEVTDRHGREIK